MTRHLFAVAAVIGFFSAAPADDISQAHGYAPRLLIASGIDADGNLIVSATEQRQKKVMREIETNGKKTTVEGTFTGPVMLLNRQTVSLKDATISDLGGNKISLDEARERL